jgi:hypothetical protein
MTDKDAKRLLAIDANMKKLSDEYFAIVAPNSQELAQMEELLASILYYLRHEVNELVGESCEKYVIANRVMYTRNVCA